MECRGGFLFAAFCRDPRFRVSLSDRAVYPGRGIRRAATTDRVAPDLAELSAQGAKQRDADEQPP